MPLIRGDRIRQERERLGLTQNQLAVRLKMSGRQIQRLESGESDLTGDTLIRLARTLGVSMDYLAGLSSERTGRMPEISDEERSLAMRLKNVPQAVRDLILGFLEENERLNRK